jgi:hypothetical protein
LPIVVVARVDVPVTASLPVRSVFPELVRYVADTPASVLVPVIVVLAAERFPERYKLFEPVALVKVKEPNELRPVTLSVDPSIVAPEFEMNVADTPARVLVPVTVVVAAETPEVTAS